MSAHRAAPTTTTDLTNLSMTKLEKRYAVHSKDERNVSLRNRQRNWDAMLAILTELGRRANESSDELLQLRYAKATLRLLLRSLTSVKKYGSCA
jgi:hypothetical protein